MAYTWQFIPRGIMGEQRRKAQAEAWGARQRAQMAREWAERQLADMRWTKPEDLGAALPRGPVTRIPERTGTRVPVRGGESTDYADDADGRADSAPESDDWWQRSNEFLRQTVPAWRGAGDVLGRTGEALEWAQENVFDPALNTTAAPLMGFARPEQNERVGLLGLARNISERGLGEGVRESGRYWREEVGEAVPGMKFAADVLLPAPGPGEVKALAGGAVRLGEAALPALGRAGRALLEEAGAQLLERAPMRGFAGDLGGEALEAGKRVPIEMNAPTPERIAENAERARRWAEKHKGGETWEDFGFEGAEVHRAQAADMGDDALRQLHDAAEPGSPERRIFAEELAARAGAGIPLGSDDLQHIITRVGAAGDRFQGLEPGARGDELTRLIPELNPLLDEAGVRLENALSVGRGFWKEGSDIYHELDLDMVVRGTQQAAAWVAANLGKTLNEKAVMVAHVAPDGSNQIATIRIPGLAPDEAERMAETLGQHFDGWHFGWPGDGPGTEGVLTIANQANPEDFLVRMNRAIDALRQDGFVLESQLDNAAIDYLWRERDAVGKRTYDEIIHAGHGRGTGLGEAPGRGPIAPHNRGGARASEGATGGAGPQTASGAGAQGDLSRGTSYPHPGNQPGPASPQDLLAASRKGPPLRPTALNRAADSATLKPPKEAGLRQFWDRARNVIADQGPSGQRLAAGLQEARDIAETTAGGWVREMPTVRGLSKMEFENFVDVAEGAASASGRPINKRVAEAAAEWARVREHIFYAARNAMLDIGRIENYFPHVYDPSMFKGDKWLKAVEHLVETGQAETRAEAAKLLRHTREVIRNRREGNLEVERLVDLPGYEKTKEALFGYVEGAANRIAQVRVFGQEDELAMRLIDKIADEGGDAWAAKQLFDVSVRAKKYDENLESLFGGIRAFQVLTKLGLGAITNLGQSVNTATVTGLVRTAMSAPKAKFSPEAKDFALKAGVTLDGVLKDLREGSGFAGRFGGVGAPFFNDVERFNRTLAAWAGKGYAEELGRKVAKGDLGAAKGLQKLGLDSGEIARRGGALTEDEQIKAARSIVERTQFKVDPQDLPYWASSPWGKLLLQFRTFSYNQTAFMWREVIEPAVKERNVAPMTRFVLLAPIAGGIIMEGKNALRFRDREEEPVKYGVQAYGQAGGLGVFQDIITGLFPMNAKYLSPDRRTTMALSTLFGPTMGTVIEGYGAGTMALAGKQENAYRFGMRLIPVVGGTAQNVILPYKKRGGAPSPGESSRETGRRGTARDSSRAGSARSR